jgi:DNA repair exonuclease SbcCD nuclease subunit
LPWVDKGAFYQDHCIGLNKSESEKRYTEYIYSILEQFKREFSTSGRPCLLFGHAEIQGTQLNPGHMLQSGSFSYTLGSLANTGADYISLGHIHKRDGVYAGALYQNNFGEEGNSQGFEIITIHDDDNGISDEYFDIDLLEFKTVDIKSGTDLSLLSKYYGHNLKIRFYSENLYHEIVSTHVFDDNTVIERCWNNNKYVKRTEKEINAETPESELLAEYIKLNPLPDNLTMSDLQGVQ